jgi:hypothetical protein
MKLRGAIVALCVMAVFALAGLQAEAGLIANYNFNASNATDLSGNSNNGIVGSNVAFSTDTHTGTGLAMQTLAKGSTYVVTVPTSPSLESINDSLTIGFWMKGRPWTDSSDTWIRIFQHGTEGNPSRTWLVDRYGTSNGSNVRVDTNAGPGGVFNQNIAVGGTDVFDSTWHHVAFVLDKGSWAKYVDGVSVLSGTYAPGDGLYNTQPLYISGQFGNGDYVGLLDDIAIYNTPLNAELVAMLKNGAPAGNLPEPASLTLLGLGALGLLTRRRRTC